VQSDNARPNPRSGPTSVIYGEVDARCTSGPCVHELFERQAAQTPAASAVVDIHRQLSFRELSEESSLLARLLQAHGVKVRGVAGFAAARCLSQHSSTTDLPTRRPGPSSARTCRTRLSTSFRCWPSSRSPVARLLSSSNN
jgi:non-ribosomal peptide synthetase component F